MFDRELCDSKYTWFQYLYQNLITNQDLSETNILLSISNNELVYYIFRKAPFKQIALKNHC